MNYRSKVRKLRISENPTKNPWSERPTHFDNAIKHGKASLFADDTNIILSDKSLVNLKLFLNFDLSNLFTWLCANKSFLCNISKTEV